MAKEYELLPGAAPHTDTETGEVYRHGDGRTITSEQPLDKLYKGKFRAVGATRAAKPRDHDPTLNESGGRQMDRPGEGQDQQQERPKTGRAARGQKPVKEVAQTRVKDFDYPEEEGKEDEEKEGKANTAKPDRGAKPERQEQPEEEVEEEEEENDDEEDEEEDVESQFGEDVTTEFRGAKKAGLQVFHDEDAGEWTVVKADKPAKAIHTDKLKTKAAVNRIVADNKE